MYKTKATCYMFLFWPMYYFYMVVKFNYSSENTLMLFFMVIMDIVAFTIFGTLILMIIGYKIA